MRWDELSPAGSSGFSQQWLNRLGRGARPDHSCKRSVAANAVGVEPRARTLAAVLRQQPSDQRQVGLRRSGGEDERDLAEPQLERSLRQNQSRAR